jgi:hypothetical protein
MPARPAVGDPAPAAASTNPMPLGAGGFHDVFWLPRRNDSAGLPEGREGQSWAEKSLKNGRILVAFQKLRKPQDAKGTCFPRNSPSTLLEWGSGGRWFESSRPDIARPVGTTRSDWPFSHLGDSFRPRGRVAGRDSNVPYYRIPFLGSVNRGCCHPPSRTAERDPLRGCASIKHAPWAISNVPRVPCHRHATLNLWGSPQLIGPSLRRAESRQAQSAPDSGSGALWLRERHGRSSETAAPVRVRPAFRPGAGAVPRR